jgi:hypothetical protein
MFSTLFYLLLVLYEGIFAKSTTDYNAEIVNLNNRIEAKDYKKAYDKAKVILDSRIFNNSEIEKIVAILELKIMPDSTLSIKHPEFISSTIEDDILISHYFAINGNSPKGLSDLHQSIVQNGNVDTLIRSYELYAFYFPQNKLKKQAKSTQMMSQTQKINTQEALSLLNLMKKKQKNFIF